MLLHLYIIRHGQTYFNRYNRLQGWSNSPLTEEGRADALRAGRALSHIEFAAAFCSDTSRAQQTARIILDANEAWRKRESRQGQEPEESCELAQTDAAELTADRSFREQFYGYFEGQDMGLVWWAAGAPHGTPTYKEIVATYGLAASRNFLKEADPFHDAESDKEYWQRIDSGFHLIASQAEEKNFHDGNNILLISHGNTLLSLMNRFAPHGYDLSVRPANGSLTRFDFETDRPLDQAITVIEYNTSMDPNTADRRPC